MITLNSHRTSKSINSIIPKKKKRVTQYASYFCAKSSPIKLLHVNMYANFLTIPSSACYYCPDSNLIKPNHVNTIQMTNTANFSTVTRQLLTISPCSLRQKHIQVLDALHCISSELLHQVQSYQVNSLHVPITIMQLSLLLY